MLELLIAADDRTGALEVAAAVADRQRPVLMAPWGSLGDDPMSSIAELATTSSVVVVDLGSRHLAAGVAAARAAALDRVTARRHGHKIDSGLRGNWAAELAARVAARPRPLVVAAALPSAHRSVRDGVVGQLVEGRWVPIAEVMAADPRRAPGSSRPADHLRAAGGVADAAIPDLHTPEDLRDLGVALADRSDVLFAGTAEAVAAWATPARAQTLDLPPVDHVVVVVGSRHEAARRQVAALRAGGLDGGRSTIVTAPDASSGTVDPTAAERVAGDLAARARIAVAAHSHAARVVLLVIGGDTAAAVLGDHPRHVEGMLAPGAAYSLGPPGPAVTRAGSFGADDALLDLVRRLLHVA